MLSPALFVTYTRTSSARAGLENDARVRPSAKANGVGRREKAISRSSGRVQDGRIRRYAQGGRPSTSDIGQIQRTKPPVTPTSSLPMTTTRFQPARPPLLD